MTGTTTLLDYANDRENVVLFCASFGTPMGEYYVMGHPDMNFADERGLDMLTGTVDEDDNWNWDGEGDPTNYHRNTITELQAYVGAKRWASVVKEYDDAARA